MGARIAFKTAGGLTIGYISVRQVSPTHKEIEVEKIATESIRIQMTNEQADTLGDLLKTRSTP